MMRNRRQAFGQHFLKDTKVISQILESAASLAKTHNPERVLEIGPGRGAITYPLLDSKLGEIPFVAVEKDSRLFEALKDKGVQLIENDFLELEPKAWKTSNPILVVSNLPYSSGTAILKKLDQERESICGMVLMFQKEVAERLRAELSVSKKVGSLTLWFQNRWDITRVATAPPGSFRPPPKVTSEVIQFVPRQSPRIPLSDQFPEVWQKLLTSAFSQRRRMLRKVFDHHEVFKKALERSGLDVTKRAEALSWKEWEKFFEEVVRGRKPI